MIGIDKVYIPKFASQLALPGTTFLQNFTAFEINDAKKSVNFDESLSGKWAAKEAFIKAWSISQIGNPPLIERDLVDYSQIEVRKDSYMRPYLMLSGKVFELFSILDKTVYISITHDGEYAVAVCMLTDRVQN